MKKYLFILVFLCLCLFVACSGGHSLPDSSDGNVDGGQSLHVHKFEEWSISEHATCTEDGVKVRYCDCGEKQTESIAALGHTEVIDKAVEPTCTETGLTEGKHCSVCDEVMVAQRIVYENGHTEVVDKAVEATCTEAGITWGKHCSVCNEVIVAQKVVDAKGHTKVVDSAIEPTCTETGLTEGTSCSDCGEVFVAQKVVDAKGHTEVIDKAVEPTCTETGLTEGSSCSDCGEIFIAQEIIASKGGHQLENRVCLVCGEKDYSKGLKFTSNRDGTCYVSGIGTCKDTYLIIPHVSPDGDIVTGIGKSAFEGVVISTVELPSSVIYIADYAFYNSFVRHLILAENSQLKRIGDHVFASLVYSSSLTSIHINDIAAWCQMEYQGSIILTHTSVYLNNKLLSKLEIPDGVTFIRDHAFSGCDSLASVVIPDSVITIGKYVFSQCDSLSSVNIGNGVTSIGEKAFAYCDLLTSVVIGCGVKSIGEDVFDSCGSLTSVYITDVAKWCNISFANNKSNPLYYARNLYLDNRLVTELEIPDGVTNIGKHAFSNCGSLASVVIPDSVITIGDQAFSGCGSLLSVELNSVITIGYQAFSGCGSLASVVIPDSVITIGNSAFSGCGSLLSVELNSVITIGDSAFSSCYKLAEVINNSVLDITAGSSDHGCIACYAIEVHSGESKIVNQNGYILYNYNNVDYILDYVGKDTELVLPDGVEVIRYGAFENSKITSVIIPNSVINIGEYAFHSCHSLTSVEMGNGVISIGIDAFSYCKSLISVEIGNGVTSIGRSAFDSCSSLTSVYITDVAKWCNISFANNKSNPLYYARNLYLDNRLVTELEIPDGVTNISKYAFYGSDLTSVIIHNGVTNIGDFAFSYCYSLERIRMGNGVTSIGEDAFYYCSSLTSVYITDVAKWCNISFTNNTSNPLYCAEKLYLNNQLTIELVIPDGVTSIGRYAFCDFESLIRVEIPSSVVDIGYSAFQNCSRLSSVTFEENSRLTSIGSSAFSNCKLLTSIVIPDGVTIIPNNVFYNCTSLTSVVIPNSVTKINNKAFSNCTLITDVYYTGTKEEWAEISIDGSNTYLINSTIHYNYVPEE